MESERDRKIRERAYELWVEGGHEHGREQEHWLKAEQEFSAGSESPMAEAESAKAKASKEGGARKGNGKIGAQPAKALATAEPAASPNRGTRSSPGKAKPGPTRSSPKG